LDKIYRESKNKNINIDDKDYLKKGNYILHTEIRNNCILNDDLKKLNISESTFIHSIKYLINIEGSDELMNFKDDSNRNILIRKLKNDNSYKMASMKHF